jgi:PKD repeat protein
MKQVIRFLLLLLVGMLPTGKYFAQTPVASFTVSAASGCAPLSVNFSNTSLNASSYQWDFGNGNFSTLVNPQNVYIQPGSYSVRLIAIAANGSRDTLDLPNLITAAAGPQISVSVNSQSGCSNYTAFQFACASVGATNFNWDFGDGSTSSLQNPTKTYASPGTYAVSLLATNSNGCQTVANLPAPISIIAPPQAGFTVSETQSCDLNHVFAFNPLVSSTDTYTWHFGDGSLSNDVSPLHAYGQAGMFDVSLVMTNAYGCVDSFAVVDQITVFPDNTPQITANPLSGCVPLATTLQSNVPGALSYQWTCSNGQTASTPDFSQTFFQPGLYDFSVSVLMPNGCSYTNPTPVTVQVNPKPVAAFTATNTVGCAPLQVQLQNTSTGATNYYWTFGDGTYSFDANPTLVYPDAGVYSITLKAFNDFGCWRTSTFNGVTVTAPTIQASVGNTTGCPPLTPTFSNTTLNAVSYLWDFGNGDTSTDSIPNYTYTSLGQYPIMLIAYGLGGCTDTLVFPGGINVSAELANYPTPPPISGCAPFVTSFGLNDPSITNYFWDFGDGTTSTAASPTHTYTTPGNYTVSLQVNNGSVCGLSYPIYQQITVEGITPTFDVAIDPCPPHMVHFTDTISDAVSWLWDFGDGTTSTQQNPTHQYATTNNYHVGLTITTAAGCVHTFVGFNAVTFTDYQPSFSTTFNPNGTYPLPVNFTANAPGAVSWLWDFGDGTTSTQANPTHVYASAGNYVATLTVVINGCTLTVDGFPLGNSTSGGSSGSGGSTPPVTTDPSNPFVSCAPAQIHFFRQSPSHQVISWNFGDGTSSNLQDPLKVYTTPGMYNVSYLANTPNGVQTIQYASSVLIGGFSPQMQLSTSATCDSFMIDAQLQNASTFQAVSWVFGTSPPVPGFQASYTTALTNSSINVRAVVQDTLGCTAIRNQNLMMNRPVPFVDYPSVVCRDSIRFEQVVPNNGNWSLFWDFGDGTTSTAYSPVHQYDSTGVYAVDVQIITPAGCVYAYTLSPSITFTAPPMDLQVLGNLSGCAPLEVQFVYPGTLSFVSFYDAGNVISSGDTLVLMFPDSGTYNQYSMIATTTWNTGCRDTLALPTIQVYDAFPDFSFVQDANCLPVTAQFTDLSPDAVAWYWDFGNGYTSTDQHPSMVFTTAPGDSVSLRIETSEGCIRTITKPGIQIYTVDAQFSVSGACNPLPVHFTAHANLPGTLEWFFGDGNSALIDDTTYVYQTDGNYLPYVVATSISGCRDTAWASVQMTVSSITADFVSPTPAACAPSIVEFFDSSGTAVSWEWDFGDNSGSALQHPVKLYDTPGVYDIRLVVTSPLGCRDTLIKPQFVTVLGPATSFQLSSAFGCTGQPVQFQDMSVDAVEWEWNFGQGSSSTEHHPSFVYDAPGQYVVTLFSRDSVGCSAFYALQVPFEVFTSPQAAFQMDDSVHCTPMAVQFSNQSSLAVQSSWDFGNGLQSVDSDPATVYTQAGYYAVQLVVTSLEGCRDTLLRDSLHALHVPVAAFSATPTEGCAPLAVNWLDESTALENPSYTWILSNGDTLQGAQPQSVFAFPGGYDATLMVTNANGCADTLQQVQIVEVFDTIPPPVVPLQRVTVESDASVKIEWSVSAASDFNHYRLSRYDNAQGAYVSIFETTDIQQTNFVDSGLQTLFNSYCYRLETIDHCNLKAAEDSIQEHCTIDIEAGVLHDNLVLLSWNAYVGRQPGQYVLRRAYEDGNEPMQDLVVVPGTITSYTDSSVVCPGKYRYEVWGIELDGMSHLETHSDNSVAVPAANPFEMQHIHVGRSTVVDNAFVLTEWAAPDTLADYVTAYKVFRSIDNVQFEEIATVPVVQTLYVDQDVDVMHEKYYYRVFATNTCGLENAQGMGGDNIVLRVHPIDNVTELVKWTPYEGWGNSGVGFYAVEKQLSDGTWKTIDFVPGDTHQMVVEK